MKDAPAHRQRTVAPRNPAHKRFVSSEMRSDGGPGFWLTSDRPFARVITDATLDAAQMNKPVPTVLTSLVPTP